MTEANIQLRLSKLKRLSLNSKDDSNEFVLLSRKVICLKKTPTSFMLVGIIFDTTTLLLLRLTGYSNNCDNFDQFTSINIDDSFTLSSFMRGPNAVSLQKTSKFTASSSRCNVPNSSILSGLSSGKLEPNPFISTPLTLTSIRLCDKHLVVCRFCNNFFEEDVCSKCLRTEQKVAFTCVIHLSDETMTIRCLAEESICMGLLGLPEHEVLDAIEEGCLKSIVETRGVDTIGKFCYLLSQIPKHSGRIHEDPMYRVDRFFKFEDFEQNVETTKKKRR